MKLFFRFTIFSVAAITLFSCKEEEPVDSPMTESNVVTFVIGSDEAVTKSAVDASAGGVQTATFNLSEEGDENALILVETVSSMDDACPGERIPQTKALSVFTGNFDELYGDDFRGTAFEDNGVSTQLEDAWGSFLGDKGTVKFARTAENTYAYEYSKGQAVNLAWPDNGKLIYFLQAPYGKTSAFAPEFYGDGHIEFDYTDPNTVTEGAIVNGSVNQTDLLFTSRHASKPSAGAAATYNILMYHALTAVKFQQGNDDDEVKTAITKITFNGISSKGHCSISPSYESGVVKKSSSCVTWTDLASPVTYAQDFVLGEYVFGEGTPDELTVPVNATVSYNADNSYSSMYDKNTGADNLVLGDDDEVLLFIPQKLEGADKKGVEVTVDFTVDGKPFSRKVRLNSEWKAGEIHTYTLTVNKVDMDVTDQMNTAKTEKNSVTTSNTGNVTAYLRASYAIAWYYGYGENAIAVAAYQGNGVFVYNNPVCPDGAPMWIKGDDGYYYYRYPILPGKSTDYPIFSKFTAPQNKESCVFQGSHLELKLLLQGVQYDEDKSKTRVKAAWGDVTTTIGGTQQKVVDLLFDVPEHYGL